MSTVLSYPGSIAGSGYETLLRMDQALLDAIPAALYVCAADGQIARCNRRATELWGRTPKIGDSDERFCGGYKLYDLDGTPVPHAATPMAYVLQHGTAVQEREVVVERPDGSRIVCLVNIQPLKSPSGVLQGAINCFLDITEQKRWSFALGGSDVKPSAVLDALPAAIYTTDEEGYITFFNRAAAELAGLEPELQKDKFCVSWRIYNADGTYLPHDQCPMAVTLAERRPVRNVEILAERPDGTRIPVMPFPTPLHDASGKFCGAVNLLIDISDLNQARSSALKRMEEQAALYRFTDRLYRASSSDDIYEAALDAIMSVLHCSRASILLFDEQGTMRFVAWRGLSEDYRNVVEGHSPWECGDRDPQPIYINDICEASDFAALQSTVTAEGIRGLAFIPLVAEGGVIGKFMVYYDDAHIFSSEERDVAITIARHIGFSIERKRAEEGRRQAEEELRRNEARLQSMFEHAGVGMALMDGDGVIVRTNPAYCAITGRSADELTGSTSARFTHPDDLAVNNDAMASLQSSETPAAFETRYATRDGAYVWARITLSVVGDNRILAIVENVDARKRAEESVRQSANQLALVTNTAPVLIAHCDKHMRYKFVNKAYAERFGVTPADCIGRSIAEVIGVDAFAHFRTQVETVLSGKPVDFEIEAAFKGPGRQFVRCSYAPEFDENGEVVGWVAAIIDITDRRQAEEALRQSEERFRAIVNTTPECVKLVAPDGTLLHMNSSGLTMIGAESADAVLGRSIFDVISPEHRETFRQFNEKICSGEKGSLEFDVVGLKGRRRHMETHAAPFLNPDGSLVQLAVTRDITERREGEEHLRRSQAHLRLTTEAARIGTWQWDIKANELLWSPIHKQLWGYEPEPGPLPFEKWAALLPDEDLRLVDEAIERTMKDGVPYDVEYRVVPRGGTETRWIRSTGRADFNDAGEAVLMQGVSLDITDRKQAEERLRESEMEFRTLADNIHHFTWMTDASGWIYWYNKRWFEYTGTTLDDVKGWGWRSLQHPDYVERVTAKFAHCIKSGEPWEDTFPLRGKDGEYRWFLSRALPIHDNDGNVVRWFGTNTDITERLRAEQQRMVLINELNHRVKNTLATVQAIAAQTLRGAEIDRGVQQRLEMRLIALSNAHSILTQENWEGAEIRAIIAQTLQPHATPEQFQLEGQPLRLSPKAAVAIAMGVHELATNAVKYGALSNGIGQIAVRWGTDQNDPEMLTLRWEERGGPPVRHPEKRGFGSRLLERNLAHDLGGNVRIDYPVEGVICSITGRLDYITGGSEAVS